MSTQTTTKIEFSDVECAVCGLDGGPDADCSICHGNAQKQSRAYTLSEERSGRVPEDHESRYRQDGAVGPKIITYLPGSGGPGGGIGN